MPTSYFSQISDIMRLIILTDPKKLLDIGVGFGKYGFLSREYLELWDGREQYSDWNRRIDGIEAFKEYITPVHDFIYDNIYIGDAIDILQTTEEKYDLILLIDVLEHFDYDSGLRLLQACEKHGRNILISIPNDIGTQEDAFGNPYEIHRFQWEKKHFLGFKNSFFLPNPESLLVYIGENSQKISRSIMRRPLRRKIGRMLDALHLKEPIKRLLKK